MNSFTNTTLPEADAFLASYSDELRNVMDIQFCEVPHRVLHSLATRNISRPENDFKE